MKHRHATPPQKAYKQAQPAQQQQQAEPVLAETQPFGNTDEFGPRPSQRFGALRQKLNVEEIPNYEQRWINDIPGRIDYAKQCGYSHVNDEAGNPIYRVVNKGGMRAYRMKIPKPWYDEAKAEEQEERVDSVERDIRQGITGRHMPGQQGAYVPTYGPNGPQRIKIDTNQPR